MRYYASVLLAASCCAVLPAQEQAPKAQNFLFDGYTTVMHLDMKRMRDRWIWDEVGAQPGLKLIFKTLEDQFGYSLDSLNRATTVMMSTGPNQSEQEVAFVETEEAMKPSADQDDMVASLTGNYTMLASRWNPDSVQVQVTPKLRVFGPLRVIQNVLEGNPLTGVPSADVMSLTVGQKDLLGYAVLDFDLRSIRQNITEFLGEPNWPEDDKPLFFAVRLSTQGDEDDPHLKLEAVVRHGIDGKGLIVSETAVAARLKELMAMKEARLFMPMLKQIKHKRDRTDAIWSVDLGRARDFGGMLSMLAPFLMISRTIGQAEQVMMAAPARQKVQVAEPPPPPPLPPTGNGGGGQQ
jgi:hypothetical protein